MALVWACAHRIFGSSVGLAAGMLAALAAANVLRQNTVIAHGTALERFIRFFEDVKGKREPARAYSLSSAPGDWKASKAYRLGLNWNNPLLPVSVVDTISAKTLPPTRSFCSVNQSNLVISALKKADLGPEILLRAYEIEGAQADTTVEFLGRDLSFGEVNLLEEDQGQGQFHVLRAGPCAIKTIKIQVQKAAK